MSILWATVNGAITPNLLSRSPSELQVESSYLLNTLLVVNQKVNELLRCIPPLEQLLLSNSSSKEKRKSRKQLGWVRCRLGEASRQEQTIHQRLGQLTWEIQQRQRVIFLEEERRNYAQHYFGLSSSSHKSYSQLDPTAPAFLPLTGRKQVWEAPGTHSAHIPWQSYAYNPTCHAGIGTMTVQATPGDMLYLRTEYNQQNNNTFFNINTLSPEYNPNIADYGRQTSLPSADLIRLPAIVHRSSSASDLMGSFTSPRRNSLPSPMELETFSR